MTDCLKNIIEYYNDIIKKVPNRKRQAKVSCMRDKFQILFDSLHDPDLFDTMFAEFYDEIRKRLPRNKQAKDMIRQFLSTHMIQSYSAYRKRVKQEELTKKECIIKLF